MALFIESGLFDDLYSSGVVPGTAFEDIPEDWVCPVCGLGKDAFEEA